MTTAPTLHHRRTTCRGCGATTLAPFLHLGEQALANALLRSPAEFATERRFPLEVVLCTQCGLVQLVDVIAPEVLFSNYLYVTGTSDTMKVHNAEYAETICKLLGLGPNDLVVEAASNDGSLLAKFKAHGVRVLGVEPATNIAAQANSAGITTANEFFSGASAKSLRAQYGAAAAVIANNVLAHVDEPVKFLAAAKALLRPGGIVSVEAPYIEEFVEHNEYDTVYHEHLCYFSISALMVIAERAGLRIFRVDRKPVHGGSIRMYAKSAEEAREHAPAVVELARAERGKGYTSLARMQVLARAVEKQRTTLVALLHKLKLEGKTVGAYGAPAKGNTLLQYCSIGTDLVPFTVDKSPLKIGLFTPGMHLPVYAADELAKRRPDYCLILAWNFADEIMRQQAAYRELGGRFIVPIPTPRIV
ncbi:MAG: methyltransferase domain-containing protein [Planctomycetes bacterium]|nr:methyltransferase domain-containing protein [Planctomycetota bacterium]